MGVGGSELNCVSRFSRGCACSVNGRSAAGGVAVKESAYMLGLWCLW